MVQPLRGLLRLSSRLNVPINARVLLSSFLPSESTRGGNCNESSWAKLRLPLGALPNLYSSMRLALNWYWSAIEDRCGSRYSRIDEIPTALDRSWKSSRYSAKGPTMSESFGVAT